MPSQPVIRGSCGARSWGAAVAAMSLMCLILLSGKLLSFRRGGANREIRIASSDAAPLAARKVRVGLFSAPYKRRPYGLNFTEGVKLASFNSGNQIWEYGAQLLLDPAGVEYLSGPDIRTGGASLPYPTDAFLLGTANLFMNESACEPVRKRTQEYMDMIRTYMAPTVMVGLGVQADFGTGVLVGANASAQWKEKEVKPTSIVLHPEQKQLYLMIKNSTGEVIVRGAFTRDVIVANGLPAPLVLGCPSLLINHDPRMGFSLEAKRNAVLAARDHANLRLAVGLPAIPTHPNQGVGYHQSRPLVRFIAENIIRVFPKSFIVVQTRHDIETAQAMRQYGVELGPDRIRYFYDPEHWIEGMREQADFMFSFRIHGALASVTAGVPAVVVSTDYRMLELATAMRMAITSLADTGLDVRPFDLFNFIAEVPFDGLAFDRRRTEVAKQYAELLTRLKLPLNPGIARIAAGSA